MKPTITTVHTDPQTGAVSQHTAAAPGLPGSAPLHPGVSTPPVQTVAYRAPRRRWAGFIAAGVIGAGIAALAVSSFYDDRSVGQKLDDTVANVRDSVRTTVDDQVQGVKQNAAAVAQKGAATGDRVASSLADAGITASVKAALAADPSLSALQVSVATSEGVVTLSGPAPDEKSRERAAVLAGAPEGVRSVVNQLVIGNRVAASAGG